MFARLFLLFITVPVIELFIFLVIGQRIGIPMTLGIIVFTAFLGAYLAKSQGLKVFARYRESLSQGRLPHEAIIDGLLILIAGALLLTPGFLTDSIGFALLAPSVRNIVRGLIEKSLKARLTVAGRDLGDPVRAKNNPQVITVEAGVVEISTDRTRSDNP